MKKLCLLLFGLMVAIVATAQQRIGGQVVDSQTGEPIIGASVTLKSNPKTGAA